MTALISGLSARSLWLGSSRSSTEHPYESSKVDVEYWHTPVWAFFATFNDLSASWMTLRMMACVDCLSPFEAIHQRPCVTTSTFFVKLGVKTLQATLSSWMMVVPCLTVKSYPDWCWVTAPPECTVESCGLGVLLEGKLDAWIRFVVVVVVCLFYFWFFTLFFSLFLLLFSSSFSPLSGQTMLLKGFWHKCFTETLELVSAPFPFIGLLELCQRDLLAVFSLLDPSTSCLVGLFHVLGSLLW